MIKVILRLTLATALMMAMLLSITFAAENGEFSFALNASGDGYIVAGYAGSDSVVVVPDWHEGKPVTGIGTGAFMGNTLLTKASLPSSIKSIGASAFKNCSRLATINTYTASAEPPAAARLPGDANVDGIVNLYDALIILKYDLDPTVAINTSNADVNADGKADIHDALKIMQKNAGWYITLQ